jgi:hypothetical protein
MFSSEDAMIALGSEIHEQMKSLPAGRQTILKGVWGSQTLSTGVRLHDNGMSRGEGKTGAAQDREWEIAHGLRPNLARPTTVLKAAA